jgi:hypothetical protein
MMEHEAGQGVAGTHARIGPRPASFCREDVAIAAGVMHADLFPAAFLVLGVIALAALLLWLRTRPLMAGPRSNHLGDDAVKATA